MVVTRSCDKQQSVSRAKCSTLQGALRAGTEGRFKTGKSNSNSLQSPFSYVCCLHMTLTNKGFQNRCWPLEDMVHILVNMVH